MATLNEQRSRLIIENTELVLEWLDLMDHRGKVCLIDSMVRRYSLKQLQAMNPHIKERIEAQRRERARELVK